MNENIRSGCAVSSVGSGISSIVPRKAEQSRATRIDADDLKSRVDILDVLAALRPDKAKNIKKSGDEHRVSCFYHDPDNDPSMSVNSETGLVYCFSCQKGGDVFHVIQETLNCDFPRAVEWLAQFTGVYIPPVDYHYQKPQPKTNGDRTVTTYQYGDGHTVDRIEVTGKPKDFRQYFKGESYKKDKHPRFPMYCQSMAVASVADGSYWVQDHEGEKCVDFAWGLGFPAVSAYGNLAKTEYKDTYEALKTLIAKPFGLLIFIDNDKPGREKADLKIAVCESLNIPFKVVNWADHLDKDKGDVVDYVSANGEDKFRELVGKALSSPNKPKSNLIPLPSRKGQPIEIDYAWLDSQIEECSDNRQLEKLIGTAARRFGCLPAEIRSYIQAFRKDAKNEEEIQIITSQEDIDLSEYVNSALAAPLKQYCKQYKIRELVALTAIIAAIPSCLHNSTDLSIYEDHGFTINPNLFAGIISESGSGKSPILKSLVSKPLAAIQSSLQTQYEIDLAAYEVEMAAYKEEGEAPVKPSLPVTEINDQTMEGLASVAGASKNQSFLLLSDELAGFFKSANQYRGGKGGDTESILSLFDRKTKTVVRASKAPVTVDISLSILGTIQPDVLKKFVGDNQDANGQWARFIWAHQPMVPRKLPRRGDPSSDIPKLMQELFQDIRDLPESHFYLSDEAYDLFADYYDETEIRKCKETNPARRAVLGKQGSIVGKLILNLQLLAGIPDLEIGVDVVRRAIALAKVYMSESEKLYAGLENGIGSQIQRLVDLAGRRLAAGAESISIRDYQQSFNYRSRPSAAEIKGYFAKAESMGLGVISYKGKTQEFKVIPNEDKMRTLVDSKGDNEDTGKTLTQQEIQANEDKRVQNSSFLSSPQTKDSSFAGEPDDLIHPQPSESLAENENKGSCPHLSPLAPKPLINSGFEGDLSSPLLCPQASSDGSHLIDERIIRMGLPRLHPGKKYRIMDGDRWVSATFLEDIQVPMGGQVAVAGLLFQFYGRSIRIDRADWVQA